MPKAIVIIERWTANNGDKPSCPRCSQLDGKEFIQGQGPYPPLHPGCLCTRHAVRTEEREL